MAKPKSSQGMSIFTMTFLVGLVLAYILWGIAAGMYDTELGNRWVLEGRPSRRAGVATAGAVAVFGIIAFVSNSVMYIPSVFQVGTFIATQRPWYLFVLLLIGTCLIGFAIGTSRLERSLKENPGFKTKRQARKIALPTPGDD